MYTLAKTIDDLPGLPSLYRLLRLTPGFRYIREYDFWLTLLTWLIFYFPLRSSLPHTQFRTLSHLARYACYFRYPNSTNLVTLVHLRLSSTGTHKLICMSGIRFRCIIETRPGGALRKPVGFLKVVCQFQDRQVNTPTWQYCYSCPVDSVLRRLQENLLSCERFFTSSGTDKSTCLSGTIVQFPGSLGPRGIPVSLRKVVCQFRDQRVPRNNVHFRSSYPVNSVQRGHQETLLPLQQLLASSGIDKPTRLPSNTVHLRYSSSGHLILSGPCSVASRRDMCLANLIHLLHPQLEGSVLPCKASP